MRNPQILFPGFSKSLRRPLLILAVAVGLIAGMLGALPNQTSTANAQEAAEEGWWGTVWANGVTVIDEYTLELNMTNSDGCAVSYHPVLTETAGTVEITMQRNEVPRDPNFMCSMALRPFTLTIDLEQPLNGREIYIDGVLFDPVYPEPVVEEPVRNEFYDGYRVEAIDQYNLNVSKWHHNGCGPDNYPLVLETAQTVKIYMMGNYPPRSRDIMCTQAFREFSFGVTLDQPLGDRTVIIDGVDYTPAAS
ncbi:hypothetical protein QP027_02965 [Corynebacterium breve]|uniref:Secreted protein n=1 Tax=Corynebacterium breve TaxID=3049799 RepID=A0ABY8VH10_9CORY|nr:hypothetical protein [Corynebacterium breve]WIM68372.1 hypothetical protein QP027_02965 [Corynebacterium breve]